MTALAAPTQPGSRPAWDTTTWTGLLSPVMAVSSSPARPEPPMPATTMARGLASGAKADRSVSAHDRSAVRTWAAAEATCRSVSPGSAASITSGVSSRSAARTNSAPPQPSSSSLICSSRSLASGALCRPLASGAIQGAVFPPRSFLARRSRQRRAPLARS